MGTPKVWVAKAPGVQARVPLAAGKWERLATGSYEGAPRAPHFIKFSTPVRIDSATSRALYIFAGEPLHSRLVVGTTSGTQSLGCVCVWGGGLLDGALGGRPVVRGTGCV